MSYKLLSYALDYNDIFEGGNSIADFDAAVVFLFTKVLDILYMC